MQVVNDEDVISAGLYQDILNLNRFFQGLNQ